MSAYYETFENFIEFKRDLEKRHEFKLCFMESNGPIHWELSPMKAYQYYLAMKHANSLAIPRPKGVYSSVLWGPDVEEMQKVNEFFKIATIELWMGEVL